MGAARVDLEEHQRGRHSNAESPDEVMHATAGSLFALPLRECCWRHTTRLASNQQAEGDKHGAIDRFHDDLLDEVAAVCAHHRELSRDCK